LREEALQERIKLKSHHDKELSDMRKVMEETTQGTNEFQSQHEQLLHEIEEVFR
jgi:hypothetical protein